ncbi:hypothetical protein HQ560_22315 [bacterium]|nr:hypothetical protein [bacterium]
MSGQRPRTDTQGRAWAGSQRQIQIYVNRRVHALSEALRTAVPELSTNLPIRWVSPLREEGCIEYQDAAFLTKLGLQTHADALHDFWPRGGPVWDALAVVGDGAGAVIVEAKSHVPEIRSGGCQASPDSRKRIAAALAKTKEWLGVGADADWLGPLYQSANRLAHLCFLREIAEVPTWLVNIYFLNDPHSPTFRGEWDIALAQVKTELGLRDVAVPFTADVFLEASPQREEWAERGAAQ